MKNKKMIIAVVAFVAVIAVMAGLFLATRPETVEALVRDLFKDICRSYVNLPAQTGFHWVEPGERTEEMEVAQGKLAMGFVSSITLRDQGFVAMQLRNLIFGAGMTSKLFMHIREKLSLCYDIGSGYHGAKGLLTVSAGIDCKDKERVITEILAQLEACKAGEITEAELEAAKQAMYSRIRNIHDTPGAIEGFYGSSALSGLPLTPEEYRSAVEQTSVADVASAARTVELHTTYFLKGVQ